MQCLGLWLLSSIIKCAIEQLMPSLQDPAKMAVEWRSHIDKRIAGLEQSVKGLKELHKGQHLHALEYQKLESSAAKVLDREDTLALR